MRSKKLLSVAFGLFCAAGLVDAQSKSPNDQEKYRAAADYSRSHRGVAMVVMKGEQIIFEDYASLLSSDMPWFLASGTKSFVGVVCAAAVEDKLISGFDEKVADTVVEWKNDPRKSKITVRQLLTLTSGIEAGEIGSVPSYRDAIGRPAVHDPGTRFEYGPVPFQIFGELMTRKLRPRGETLDRYLKRRILDPIGLNVSMWRKNGDQPLLPQGAALRAREWIKFGGLLKNRGKWKGKQLIRSKLLDELLVGTKANPAYGMTFWLNANGVGPSGADRKSLSGDIGTRKLADSLDIYMAAGAGNQRLYVIPSMDIAVVRFGFFGDFDDREFISKLLTAN